MEVSAGSKVSRSVAQAEQSTSAQTPPKSQIASGDSAAARKVMSKPDLAEQTEEIRRASAERRVPPAAESNRTSEGRSIRISDDLSRAITEASLKAPAAEAPEDTKSKSSSSSEKSKQTAAADEEIEQETAEQVAQAKANETRDGTQRPKTVEF